MNINSITIFTYQQHLQFSSFLHNFIAYLTIALYRYHA